MPHVNKVDSLNEVFHKEKNQKKYNKTTRQIDKLGGYNNNANESISQKDKLATGDKQIRREANYIKNIHIDDTWSRLESNGLVNGKDRRFWCGAMHLLGVSFVMQQADDALSVTCPKHNPPGYFHFMINKAINEKKDKYMPRFNQ